MGSHHEASPHAAHPRLAATAASVGYPLTPDEQARIGAVLNNPGRLDAQTIEHLEAVLWHCKRQDDALGPRGVLDIVLAQRDLVRSLLPQCPDTLRPQLLSTLGNASRLAGWFSFNLNDFTSAVYYHDDARAHAHEAGNIETGCARAGGDERCRYPARDTAYRHRPRGGVL